MSAFFSRTFDLLRKLFHRLSLVFPVVRFYLRDVESYGRWGFFLCGKSKTSLAAFSVLQHDVAKVDLMMKSRIRYMFIDSIFFAYFVSSKKLPCTSFQASIFFGCFFSLHFNVCIFRSGRQCATAFTLPLFHRQALQFDGRPTSHLKHFSFLDCGGENLDTTKCTMPFQSTLRQKVNIRTAVFFFSSFFSKRAFERSAKMTRVIYGFRFDVLFVFFLVLNVCFFCRGHPICGGLFRV